LELYKFGRVGWPVGGETVGWKVSLMAGWGKMEGEVKEGERVDEKGQKE
jgi:hypothetical protein